MGQRIDLDRRASKPARGLPAAVRRALPVGGYLTATLALAASLGLAFPTSSRPSVSLGREVYRQHCAACHDRQPNVARDAWREEHGPRAIATAALGQRNHPQVLSEPTASWHVTAYLWSRGVTAQTYRLGEALALEAQARLERDGLWLLLTRFDELSELRDVNWVMSHGTSTVHQHVRYLAGAEYETLSEAERDALVAYIYNSHFELPWDGSP